MLFSPFQGLIRGLLRSASRILSWNVKEISSHHPSAEVLCAYIWLVFPHVYILLKFVVKSTFPLSFGCHTCMYECCYNPHIGCSNLGILYLTSHVCTIPKGKLFQSPESWKFKVHGNEFTWLKVSMAESLVVESLSPSIISLM